MIVYVESNYVLELVRLQETHQECEELLEMCERGETRLAIPAYSLVEPYETLVRSKKERKKLQERLSVEASQLERTASIGQKALDFKRRVSDMLTESTQEDFTRMQRVSARLLDSAEVIATSEGVLREAGRQRQVRDLSPQDAVVHASILSHLRSESSRRSCFINKNSKDFDDPDIQQELHELGCKLLFSFTAGLRYVKAHPAESLSL